MKECEANQRVWRMKQNSAYDLIQNLNKQLRILSDIEGTIFLFNRSIRPNNMYIITHDNPMQKKSSFECKAKQFQHVTFGWTFLRYCYRLTFPMRHIISRNNNSTVNSNKAFQCARFTCHIPYINQFFSRRLQ